MNEKAQDNEFEEDDDDDDADEVVGRDDDVDDDVDVEHLFRDLDKRKRAGAKVGDPAWRKLERIREEQHTAELVSDFDDYDIGDGESKRQGGHGIRQRRAS